MVSGDARSDALSPCALKPEDAVGLGGDGNLCGDAKLKTLEGDLGAGVAGVLGVAGKGIDPVDDLINDGGR